MPAVKRNLLPVLWLFFAICATAAIYVPGLKGGWLLDDQQNIVQNTALQAPASVDSIWTAAVSTKAGPLRRPVSMLSFWANFHLGSGLNPRPFKITNLAIHLLNGIAAFWLLSGLFGAYARLRDVEIDESRVRWIAAFGTTLWLVHPLALTNVLYIVQRMNSLAGMFTLLALGAYVHGRNLLEQGRRGWRWILTGLCVFTPLAMLAKENGALAPVFMWVTEYCIYQFRSVRPHVSRQLKLLYVAALVVPALAAAAYLASHPNWVLGAYAIRDFTLPERLLTEARVVWSYVGWIVLPTVQRLGLAHDDIPISHGLLDPTSTLLAIIGWSAAIVAAFRLQRRLPLLSFAILWFLGGQLLESTVFGLEIAFEHRLYLPMLGPLGVAAYYLVGASRAPGRLSRHTLLAGFIAVCAFSTFVRSTEWRDNRTMALYEVKHHPESTRANVQAGIVFADLLEDPRTDTEYNLQEAQFYLRRAADLDPHDPSSVFDLLLVRSSNNLPLDTKFVDWVVGRLKVKPMHPRILSGVVAMVHSLQIKKAKIPKEIALKIFQAALSNTDIAPNIRAGIYAQMSKYFMNVVQDPQSAVAMAIAATKEFPAEPIHHLNLAQLAIALGRVDIAKQQIDIAQTQDHLHEYAATIRTLTAQLQDTKEAAAANSSTRRPQRPPGPSAAGNSGQLKQ